jgi:hypothetical protein
MKIYNELILLLESTREDLEKFYVQGNKTAGIRARKSLQGVKTLAQQMRDEIQDIKSFK